MTVSNWHVKWLFRSIVCRKLKKVIVRIVNVSWKKWRRAVLTSCRFFNLVCNISVDTSCKITCYILTKYPRNFTISKKIKRRRCFVIKIGRFTLNKNEEISSFWIPYGKSDYWINILLLKFLWKSDTCCWILNIF